MAGAARSLLAVEDEARGLAAGGLAGLDADAAEALLLGVRADVVTLRDELAFARPIAPYLGWVPRLGPTLVAAPHLLDMADGGTEAAVLAVGSLKPALATVQSGSFGMSSLGELLPTLAAAGPTLQTASVALDRTATARAELAAAVPTEQLPWRVRQLLTLSDEWLPLGDVALGPPVGLAASLYDLGGPEQLSAPTVAVDGLRLLGLSAPPGPFRPGQAIRVRLTWQGEGELGDVRPSVALEVGGAVVAENADAPAQGRYPTDRWAAGERVTEVRDVRVPAEAVGAAELVVRDE